MDRLSLPHDRLPARAAAVVIGSGYGGGVAASRLARMGLDVVVLERGRELLPGDYPKTFWPANRAFQADLGFAHVGARDALFDMRVNPDISVLVGCGLGGTSLINGNVMLKPDPRVFKDPVWPGALRADLKTALEEGYRRATAMLAPVPYPGRVELNKLKAFEAAATALGATCSRPPITVTFEDNAAPNRAGVRQPACTLCGDCCSGCNVGAKNTVLMTYLPDAANHGARLFANAAVTHLERVEDAWRVHATLRDQAGDATEVTIEAELVVLGAGTLGSTEILLRSRERGLALSDRLGEGFTGNGDVIAFGYNNDVPIDGIGVGHPPRLETDPVGPVIAGLIDLRGAGALEDGMVIEEGAIPSVLAPILPTLMAGGGTLFGEDTDAGFKDYLAETGRKWASILKGAYAGAVKHTQTFLVMAQDGGGGRIVLKDGRARIDWPDVGSKPVFERISETLERATAATGGTYIDNPMWSKLLGRNLVTVHPLGGCAIAEDARAGVVDHRCRVFAGTAGRAVHDGLMVVDGAAMPRPLGVNPSITIAALAERAMMLLADERGLALHDAPKPDAPVREAGPDL